MIQSILEYETPEGKIPFRQWLLSLKDIQARARIRARLDRLALGNFGDCKSVGEGVFEIRFRDDSKANPNGLKQAEDILKSWITIWRKHLVETYSIHSTFV